MVTIDPWSVSGNVDYRSIIKKFGLTPTTTLGEPFNSNLLFRRNIVFAHRDFDRISQAIAHKKPFIMMTGMMPTGTFHIGHMLVAQQIIFYQQLGAHIYIAVADVEAYHTRGQSLEQSRSIAIDQYILNYIALGLKPQRCHIYFQSNRSSDSQKANAYYRLQNLLARHATFNEFRAVYGEITPGKMISALLQATDMLHGQLEEFEAKMPVIVPVGIDQDPHLRLARDLVQRTKIDSFTQLSSTYHYFMPGLDGGKMSSSLPNSTIAMTDTASQIKKKINKYAFSGGQSTVEEHRAKGGNPHIDVPFQYLRMFFEPDDKQLKQIEHEYRSGTLLSGELKKITIQKITAFLEIHQQKRQQAQQLIKKYGL